MESFPCRLLTHITSTSFEHFMAVLNHFVLLDDLLVLRALEFGKRVSILCLVLLPFELPSEFFALGSLCLDQILLLLDDLLQWPAALHPALQVLLNLFVPHLPALNFLSYVACLFRQAIDLSLQDCLLCLGNRPDCLFQLRFAAPSLFKHLLQPSCHRISRIVQRSTGYLRAYLRLITIVILLLLTRARRHRSSSVFRTAARRRVRIVIELEILL